MINYSIEKNKKIALQFLRCSYNLAMDDAVAMLDDEFTWWVLGDPGKHKVAGKKNKEQATRMLRNMYKVLPKGMCYDIIGVTAESDRVAIEVHAEGVWFNGATYKNDYHFLLRVKNDKVLSVREYLDTSQLIV